MSHEGLTTHHRSDIHDGEHVDDIFHVAGVHQCPFRGCVADIGEHAPSLDLGHHLPLRNRLRMSHLLWSRMGNESDTKGIYQSFSFKIKQFGRWTLYLISLFVGLNSTLPHSLCCCCSP